MTPTTPIKQNTGYSHIPDPSINVREMIQEAVKRVDDVHDAEIRRVDDKFKDIKDYFDLRIGDNANAANQRFEAQQLALKDALISQEKAVAAALEGTKEAINKADTNTDKRFSLLSEKIDGITNTMNKSTGERGIYVTHSDLSVSLKELQNNIETMIRPVINFMNSSTGQSKGEHQIWGYVIGVAGALAALFIWFSTHPVVTEIIKQ